MQRQVLGVQGQQPLAAVFVFINLEGYLAAAIKAGNDAVAIDGAASLGVHVDDAAFGVTAPVRGGHAVALDTQGKGVGAVRHRAGQVGVAVKVGGQRLARFAPLPRLHPGYEGHAAARVGAGFDVAAMRVGMHGAVAGGKPNGRYSQRICKL